MHLISNYFTLKLIAFITITAQIVVCDLLPTCRPEDFKYDFTECDDFGGRWRVSVPESPKKCIGGAPNAPIRVDKCFTSCDSGQFFNSTSLLCQKCKPGFYSLGGGVRIESFNASSLPSGFYITTETKHSSTSCTGWRINSNYIESMSNSSGGGCVSLISYTVKIVKRGKLRFTYQYSIPEDVVSVILFTFHYRNYDENGQEDSSGFNFDNYNIKFPSVTNEQQKWKTMDIKLPKPGLYVFVWKSVIIGHSKEPSISSIHTRSAGPFDGPPGSHSNIGVIRIKSLYVDGVAYASECTPCEAGTYSDAIGSDSCTPCPSNTAYPKRGAIKCNACDSITEYAPRGSEHCFKKPICGHNDYYKIASDCDLSKERQWISYKWIEPQICRDSNNVFPKSHFQACNETIEKSESNQICNLGMELRDDGKCYFCKDNEYRDQTIDKCKECPPSTSPLYALSLKVWHSGRSGDTSLPKYLSTQCARSDGDTELDCDSSIAWQSTAGTEQYIRTGPSTLLGSYLILSLTVPGFRQQSGGEISFKFEVECNEGDKCQFIFMESKGYGLRMSQQTSLVNQWNEKTIGIQTYRYRIEQNTSVAFSWIFKRDYSFQSNAKIYEIILTNPLLGSAIKCNPCPHGSGRNCIPCPFGKYLESQESKDDIENIRSKNRMSTNQREQCKQCPEYSVINASIAFPIGRHNSCIPCGPSLTAYNGIRCHSDCLININEDSFDLRQLKQPLIYKGGNLFTAGGTPYFHLFNITLCGKPENEAVCINNITYGSADASEDEYSVRSMICRSTVIPDREQTYATQSVSLGDELIGITRATTFRNITVHPEFQTTNSDLHFYYSTRVPTAACLSGRRLTLTIRCAPDLEENMQISTPKACPDGTCDGCNFHLLVKTKTTAACRLCRASDYETVVGECVNGIQQIHFVNPKGCILSADGQVLVESRHCSVIPRQVQFGIALVSALGVILLVLVFHFWKKNRNLEYKYCKLIEGNDKSAESCAEDDEDDDTEDQVIIQSKKHKEAYDGGYETIQLTKHNDRNEEMI